MQCDPPHSNFGQRSCGNEREQPGVSWFDTRLLPCKNRCRSLILQGGSTPPRKEKSLAEVAELADAHGSGPCTRKGVGVRVPSSAPLKASLSFHHKHGFIVSSQVRQKSDAPNSTPNPYFSRRETSGKFETETPQWSLSLSPGTVVSLRPLGMMLKSLELCSQISRLTDRPVWPKLLRIASAQKCTFRAQFKK